VTCPKRYFNNFTSVQMTPREEDFKQPDSSWRLQKVMNIRPFRIVRPADIPPGVQFSAEPTEMNVKIPLHPLDDRLDIEVRIVLRLPPGDTLGGVIPSAKTRETFSFIGPQRLLQECKKLEGTAQEIQAEIDLARLSSDRIKELKNEGIRVKPEFVYPSEAAKRLLRCEHPKSIWVSIPKPKDK